MYKGIVTKMPLLAAAHFFVLSCVSASVQHLTTSRVPSSASSIESTYANIASNESTIVAPKPPRARAANKADNPDECVPHCSLKEFGSYCCYKNGGVTCCSTTKIEPIFNNRMNQDAHWLHRFSLWNMWYFWFIVVLILATCFTGCNYWRRQRRSENFRLFHRQYTSIASSGRLGGGIGGVGGGLFDSIRGGRGGGVRDSGNNGGPQIVIPITMYEVSPDTILRLMRENAHISYHQHHHANGRSQHRRERILEQQQQDRSLHQEPPSYGEVTSKPSKYPVKVEEETQPPSYESVSHAAPIDPPLQSDIQEDDRADSTQQQQPRRLSL